MWQSDSDDDVDMYDDMLQPRAFAVDGEMPPEEGEPLTAEDYLRRVRWEANRCPTVVIAKIDPSKLQNNRPSESYVAIPGELPPPPEGIAPNAAWVKKFLAFFENFRQKLQRMHEEYQKQPRAPTITSQTIKDPYKWYTFCFGHKPPKQNATNTTTTTTTDNTQPTTTDETTTSNTTTSTTPITTTANTTASTTNAEERGFAGQGTPPLLSVLFQLDQVTLERVIEFHINWLQKQPTGIMGSGGESHKWGPWGVGEGVWLFAILARLDKPLAADTAALLRDLLRCLCNLRATLSNKDEALVAQVNMLITIVAKYFGQQPDL